jgi:HAD superfamily hydrolase (TIGR01509 family)
MFKAVIFDWDGTLADTRQAIVSSFQKTLSEINCEVSAEYIERRIGIGAAETFRDVLRTAKAPFEEGLIQQLVARKSQLEIELSSQVKLFSGVKELLEALQGKIKMGLASMNNQSVIAHMVNANGLEKYFDIILTAESISHSKPDPEIFLKTAFKLKTSPEDCVVFEDSIFGVKAAKSANMGCIAVATGVYVKRELEVERPDLVVKTLNDSRILPFILR